MARKRAEELLSNENRAIGAYSCLSNETTKEKLIISDYSFFMQGSILGSFSSSKVAPDVNRPHIDLSSATSKTGRPE